VGRSTRTACRRRPCQAARRGRDAVRAATCRPPHRKRPRAWRS
jgi:hypothetical protein